ncbi:transposase mutator type, partial [Salmonella enterica subsp. enterica serovar Enteritidis str. SE30663]
SGQALTGKDGILTPLIKYLTESTLSAELDSHLAQDVEANRKNGSGKKPLKPQQAVLNWQLRAIVTALLSHNW